MSSSTTDKGKAIQTEAPNVPIDPLLFYIGIMNFTILPVIVHATMSMPFSLTTMNGISQQIHHFFSISKLLMPIELFYKLLTNIRWSLS